MSFERNLEVYHQSFAQYYKSTPKMRSWDREWNYGEKLW